MSETFPNPVPVPYPQSVSLPTLQPHSTPHHVYLLPHFNLPLFLQPIVIDFQTLFHIIISNDMRVSQQPVDFDRLLLKSSAQTSAAGFPCTIPLTSTLKQESPLQLISSLTSQFRSHFQEVKNQLSQKVQNSAREMAKFQQIKKQLKRQDQEWEKYKDVPNVPIQVYDWREQKFKLSPRRNLSQYKQPASHSIQEDSVEMPRRTPVAHRKGAKEMEKFIYNKRFQKYLDQKYHRNPQIQIMNEGGDKGRELREEGNILSSHYNEEPDDGKLKQIQSYFLNEKESSAFTGGDGKALKFVKKYEYEYRKQAYKKIKLIGESDDNVRKEAVVRYLFDHVVMMMLYSIHPHKLVEEIAGFVTSTPNELSFVELSNFLLTPREPPAPEEYSQSSLLHAEEETFKDGIVVEPVIPYTTWLGEDEAVEDILKCFEYVDVFGRLKVPTQDLVIRLKKYASEKGLLNKQIYYITSIGKPISIQRIIFEIEFQHPRRSHWTLSSFKDLFYEYTKLSTLPREQIIQNQMVEGNLDLTLLLNTSILLLLRQVYNNSPKYCDHYVDKLEYLDGIYENSGFQKIKGCEVRRAPYGDINMETVEETLARIYYEGDQFLEMDDIIQFFTNKGRPYIVNQRVKASNSEAQMLRIEQEEMARENQDTKDSQDEDIQYSMLRQEKKRKEFRNRQRKANEIKEKMKNITVPAPFNLKEKTKESIRERKVKEMLEEKEMRIQEEMKPAVVARDVPWFVKENLFERLEEEKDSLRRRRLEAHKSYLETLMRPPAERLMKQPARGEAAGETLQAQYQFVARTMPWYCEIELLDRIVRDKLERKERIKKEIQEREFEDGTPQGIKNMMARQKVLKEKWAVKNEEKNRRAKSQGKHKPFKRKPVPNFQKIFEENGIQLEVRHLRPTEPHIETWEEHKKKRVTFKEGEEAPAPPAAKSTQKFDALVQLRRKQRIQQLVKKEKEHEDELDRKLAKQKMEPKVRAVLKRMEKEHEIELQKFGQRSDIKKQFQERQKWYAQTIYKAFENVNERPLLIESLNMPKLNQEQIEEIEERKRKEPQRKLRERPVRKALHRTDDRKKNLEQRNLYKQEDFEQEEDEEEEDYDDDEFEEEQEQFSGAQRFENLGRPQINLKEKEKLREKEREKERQNQREKGMVEKMKQQQKVLDQLRKQQMKNEFQRRILNDQYEDVQNEEGDDDEGNYYYEQDDEDEDQHSDRHVGNRSF